jgi:hypothetical protein
MIIVSIIIIITIIIGDDNIIFCKTSEFNLIFLTLLFKFKFNSKEPSPPRESS